MLALTALRAPSALLRGQDRTRQNKPEQDRTRQDKTRQDSSKAATPSAKALVALLVALTLGLSRCSTIVCNALLCSALVLSCLVWSGLVWPGLLCYGLVLSCLIQSGLVQSMMFYSAVCSYISHHPSPEVDVGKALVHLHSQLHNAKRHHDPPRERKNEQMNVRSESRALDLAATCRDRLGTNMSRAKTGCLGRDNVC
eukprot:COSAG06_NODE_9954_length_1783_cov_1.504751_1_plen_198_part_00